MGRGLISLGIVAAILVIIMIAGRKGESGALPPADLTPPGKNVDSNLRNGISTEFVAPEKRVIECENYTTLEDTEPNQKQKVMLIGSETAGEKIIYLEIPDGWIQSCGHSGQKGTGGALPGKATYEFEVPREDTYYLFLRAKWYDNCGNSVFLRLNQDPYLWLDDTQGKISESDYTWAWHPLRQKGGLQELKLKAGKNTLELNTREDGPKFDKILISTDANKPADAVVNP